MKSDKIEGNCIAERKTIENTACLRKTLNKKNAKKKNISNKNDFVAPDGGWGWLVLIATGVSNVSISSFNKAKHCFKYDFTLSFQTSTFPVIQNFGLLLGDRMKSIGLTTSEKTTIMNLNSCLTSFVGV